VAYGSHGQDVPCAPGRFPVLRCIALAAGEPAQAKRAYGDRGWRVSFARLRRGGISQASPVGPAATARARPSALGLLCESIRRHALPVLTPCSRSQR
jgi:hypothetical protein